MFSLLMHENQRTITEFFLKRVFLLKCPKLTFLFLKMLKKQDSVILSGTMHIRGGFLYFVFFFISNPDCSCYKLCPFPLGH